ncbi:uncharacterized protein LOC103959239 [Pyrus x bretschneideri]|uniref:uncharacterized protein LOC103959239 n=1 Tax=Pyrus x bretschneideri TaxID=225117 RepID=UPI00202F8F1E|nr:uncharacterized protein LOC103959239 [Pyrus x bretschneideri]
MSVSPRRILRRFTFGIPVLMNFKSGRHVHEELAKYGDLENQVLCKWTYLGHAHMQLNNEKDSREMEACGCDDDLLEEIVLGDLADGHHAKIGCRVAFPSHLPSTATNELGLVVGISVETSLVDAHIGGVGLLESVPITNSEPKECYVTKLNGHAVVNTVTDKLGTSRTHGISTSGKSFDKRKEMYGVHVDFIPFWNATLMDKRKMKKSPEEAQEVVGNMNDAAASAKQIREMEQGLTSLIVLGNGLFSDLIAQLQDILDCVNEADILLEKFDSAVIRAQIQQLDQEIRELTSSGPITIYNENSSSSGNYASYLVPVAALAAMGYCYMWWIGWSFSDVMYVTRHNMANVVEALIREVASKSNDFARNGTINTLKRSECAMGTYLDLVCSLGHMESNFVALAIDLHAEFSMFFTCNLDFRPLWDPGDATAKIVKMILYFKAVKAEWLNMVAKITKLGSFMVQWDRSVKALNKGKKQKTGDGGYSDEMESLHDLSVSKAVDMVTGFESALAGHVVNNIIRSTTVRLERLHSERLHRLPEWWCSAVSQLLMIGKSILSSSNKSQEANVNVVLGAGRSESTG